MYSRRSLLRSAGAGLALGVSTQLPAWARPASAGNTGLNELTGNVFDLTIDRFPVTIGGRAGRAIGVNGSLPAPLLRWREGEEVTLNVTNRLDADTSIHWHGLLLPFQMDGVPGVAFPGIKPGETFSYRFPVKQSGTYWYHSHSGLQEQLGHYGPIVIDPAQRRVGAVFEINDAEIVASGAVVRLTMERDIDEPGFWVPVKALSTASRGLWTIYVAEPVGSGWQVATRPVEMVHTDGDRAFVRGAVTDGERVITNGLQRIVPGLPVEPRDVHRASTVNGG